MYDIVKDPVETENVVEKHPSIREKLKSSLEEWAVEFDQDRLRFNREAAVSLSEKELETLRSLGYLQ